MQLGSSIAGFYSVLKTRQFIRAAEAAVHSFETSRGPREAAGGGGSCPSRSARHRILVAQAREDQIRARNANASVRALRNLLGIESGDFEV
jgi:hypothetical protein